MEKLYIRVCVYGILTVCEKCFLHYNASNDNLFSLPQQNSHSNPFKAVIFGMFHKYAQCIYKYDL